MGRKGFKGEMIAYLDESVQEITEETERACKEVAEFTVDYLKANSPKQKGAHGGQYAAGWTYERYLHGAVRGYIVRNATDYQLTHLLEKGHALWNGTKRVKAIRHIAPAERLGNERLVQILTKREFLGR